MTAVLSVENLKTQFRTESGLVKAVDGVSYYIDEHEIVGIVARMRLRQVGEHNSPSCSSSPHRPARSSTAR